MAKSDKKTSQHDQGVTPNAIDPRLLDILVCPKSRGPLSYDKKTGELISKNAKLAYKIRDGVPIMLVGEARRLK